MARDTVTEVEQRKREWGMVNATINRLVEENKRLKALLDHLPPSFREMFGDCDV